MRGEGWPIGLTVCYDVRFPELYRILALEGAELVTVPAHFTTPTGKDHWHVLLRARAIENQYYVAAPAQVGETLPGKPVRALADRRPLGDRARPGARRGDGHLGRARPGPAARRSRPAAVAEEPAGGRIPLARARVTLRAVLFDVDFTIARPGPELGPEGYQRLGRALRARARPVALPRGARAGRGGIKRHPELEHDEEIWVAFTERIIRGMGGDADSAYECAVEMTRAWEHAEHFELFEDALPVLGELRAQGLKLGLVSNTGRNLEEFVAHHRLDVDAALGSGAFGRTKPHPTIFQAVLERLEVEPADAAMVGDSLEDDIEGARAAGIRRAFLLDRDDRYHELPNRLPDLFALPAALGLQPG